ncbi:hypothetical protein C0Q70_11181 [Pomacea canaliculata]|uniref:Uncharacterized protein n=2 Tax=Pomacea canaliculata TaxID=400727 RepID=A0A2T7P588_POMCA|nr:hypothetical protein C0Q70_11181 [Pomacea canaliculata]
MRFFVVLCLVAQILSEEPRARLVPLANIPIDITNADLGIELVPFATDINAPRAVQVPLNWIPVGGAPRMEQIPLGLPVEDDQLVDAPPTPELIPLSDIPITEGEDIPRAMLVPFNLIPVADTEPKAELIPLSDIPITEGEDIPGHVGALHPDPSG